MVVCEDSATPEGVAKLMTKAWVEENLEKACCEDDRGETGGCYWLDRDATRRYAQSFRASLASSPVPSASVRSSPSQAAGRGKDTHFLCRPRPHVAWRPHGVEIRPRRDANKG